ncbi:hypothetical protein QTP70_014366 [Hemibagrus guttatus]|uniref:Reverse transcriptase n=1 Tax=Hemibagrus guttatus TaxID=175788 RepID=A0AAE0QZL1_9TELE|nr:hypothetical protein QTP70_014366 [Hemibagrus guttatus]
MMIKSLNLEEKNSQSFKAVRLSHSYCFDDLILNTEKWLSDRVPDAAVQLDGFTVFRANRNAALCRRLQPTMTINLEEYTTSVTGYIGKCIDDVTVSKTVTTCSNQKPWMTAEVCALLKSRDSAFRAGDKEALRTARAKLSRAIREAKHAHAQRIYGHFQDSGDSRRMWQGIQAITNYKTTPSACDSDASLPDALNDFYARFEAQNSTAARKTIPPPNDQVFCLSMADVRRTLCRVNPRKSAGPDNIPGRVPRECAEKLAAVFTDIFNISLSSAVVPPCLKTTTIVPVLKKSIVS